LDILLIGGCSQGCRGGFRDLIKGVTDNLTTKPALIQLTMKIQNHSWIFG